MSRAEMPDLPGRSASGRLADDLLALAEISDEDAAVDVLLARIAVLAAQVLAGVDYASITAWRGAGYTTVAASSDLARAVDDAQHAERAGPCVLAEQTAGPVGVPDIAATMSWPGFHRQATDLGLRASVSVPLFAGGGSPVAVLNLYGREPAPLSALDAAVREVFAAEQTPQETLGRVRDTGIRDFLVGLGMALRRRATIQQAVGMLMAERGCDAIQGNRILREWATSGGQPLYITALVAIKTSAAETGVRVVTGPRKGDALCVTVTGELARPLDNATRERLIAVLDEPTADFAWDLSRLKFCDLAGLRLLLEVRDRTVDGGRRMRVTAAPEGVRILMRITETAELFGYPAAPGSIGEDDPGG